MFNQFTGIGNLAADPESRQTQTGKQVVNFTVCCEYGYGDNKQTEFIKCVAWDKLAGIVEQFLKKGSKCMVQGTMQTRSWEDKENNKRYSTEINVQTMKMLGDKKHGQEKQEKPMSQRSTGDDVPF